MITNPIIRPATPADALHIAQLTQIAGDGIPDFLWSQSAQPGQSVLDVGIARACSVDSNFSYRNSHIAMLDDQIVALLIGYRLPDVAEDIDPNDFPDLLRPLIELERRVTGSYYINIIASYPEYQSKGIGKLLIAQADLEAKRLGCKVLSLQVFEENTRAVTFYRREGFDVLDQRPVVPHPCYPYTGQVLLMTKPVIGTNE